jgi:hypothetical protein
MLGNWCCQGELGGWKQEGKKFVITLSENV